MEKTQCNQSPNSSVDSSANCKCENGLVFLATPHGQHSVCSAKVTLRLAAVMLTDGTKNPDFPTLATYKSKSKMIFFVCLCLMNHLCICISPLCLQLFYLFICYSTVICRFVFFCVLYFNFHISLCIVFSKVFTALLFVLCNTL